MVVLIYFYLLLYQGLNSGEWGPHACKGGLPICHCDKMPEGERLCFVSLFGEVQPTVVRKLMEGVA